MPDTQSQETVRAEFEAWIQTKGSKYQSAYVKEKCRKAWEAATEARSSQLAELRKQVADFLRRLGKPRCLDCNAAGINNCSHFDNCSGNWKYELEGRAESAEAKLSALTKERDELYSTVQKYYQAGLKKGRSGEWVPVETRLPAPNSAVLFWTTDGMWESGYFRGDDQPDEGDCRWECERTGPRDERIDFFNGQVTHWMVPSPPGEPRTQKETEKC